MSSTAERIYTTMDKSTWGDGPWADEPDKIQWVDDATGFDCLIVRNRGGALCGYVGLPSEHPCHGLDYDSVRILDADGGHDWPDVHGGLTYADSCQEGGDEAASICHIPQPGRPDDVWWFGFDCAHHMDISPGMLARDRESGFPISSSYGEAYRTVAYVRSECARLARQLVTAIASEGERA
jgi:hypothetical protein